MNEELNKGKDTEPVEVPNSDALSLPKCKWEECKIISINYFIFLKKIFEINYE